MAKITLPIIVTMLSASIFLSGCSTSEADNEDTKAATVQQDNAVDLDTLIKQAEDSRAEADKLGFEWSVTQILLDEAHAAVKAGNHEQAVALFQEAKQQSQLAIEQAHYADKHWQLLVPVMN